MGGIRLQKFLAEAGVASRRKAEMIILEGRVSVNGKIADELGIKVSADDEIRVDGKIVKQEDKKLYVMLNKPAGYVTTAKDQFSRPTVLDLVSSIKERLYPVGRLDYDTSGLLLLTNDGELTYKLTHPRHEVQKVYRALVEGIIDNDDISAFKGGMKLEEFTASPAVLDILRIHETATLVQVTIHEGKNRQVRKMFDAAGHPVITLKRISTGNVSLGALPEGKWRYLTPKEIESLYQ